MKLKLLAYFLMIFLYGCTALTPYIPEKQQLDRSRLPPPDTTVFISNLSSCTDADEKAIQIDSRSPITVLVHGCNGSAGRFRSLAQLYAFHGQQAVCYSYDDRDSLVDNAEKLTDAIQELSTVTNHQNITVLGHSMGGLIARKALEQGNLVARKENVKSLELITVSAPFSGIQAASHCGPRPLHWLSLGIVPGICWLITGDNWHEITSDSNFIKHPKPLSKLVQRYLKVVTNEKGACRRESNEGECLESDYIFELSEQHHPVIDKYPSVIGVQVDAGHVEIVGNKEIAPRKLLSVLQNYGMLSPTPPDRKVALERLLAELY